MADNGVFPDRLLRKAVEEGWIRSSTFALPDASFQPSSLDLHLGETAHRLRCSFLPEGESVQSRLEELSMGEIDISKGGILERNRPYLIPLWQELALPGDVRARANPRSSTGRLDIFTRVITDRGHRFDDVPAGYTGPLYLEVVSRSFTIQVGRGLSLNQLRLYRGNPLLDDDALGARQADDPILLVDGHPVAVKDILLANGLFLSLDLESHDGRPIGYRAKKNSMLLDLSRTDSYDVADFWEPVYSERGNRLILEPEEFYLLVSRERLRIPPALCAEMDPYDPSAGELRTHYAGFFDPGFGYDPQSPAAGAKAVLEVRAHDVPFMVKHGQRLCRLAFERLVDAPDALYGTVGSAYQFQALKLSRHFRQDDSGPAA